VASNSTSVRAREEAREDGKGETGGGEEGDRDGECRMQMERMREWEWAGGAFRGGVLKYDAEHVLLSRWCLPRESSEDTREEIRGAGQGGLRHGHGDVSKDLDAVGVGCA